jgi:hypothetical protein
MHGKMQAAARSVVRPQSPGGGLVLSRDGAQRIFPCTLYPIAPAHSSLETVLCGHSHAYSVRSPVHSRLDSLGPLLPKRLATASPKTSSAANRLCFAQRSLRFETVAGPPRANGTMWSIWSACVEPQRMPVLPTYVHRPLSLMNTSSRTAAAIWRVCVRDVV